MIRAAQTLISVSRYLTLKETSSHTISTRPRLEMQLDLQSADDPSWKMVPRGLLEASWTDGCLANNQHARSNFIGASQKQFKEDIHLMMMERRRPASSSSSFSSITSIRSVGNEELSKRSERGGDAKTSHLPVSSRGEAFNLAEGRSRSDLSWRMDVIEQKLDTILCLLQPPRPLPSSKKSRRPYERSNISSSCSSSPSLPPSRSPFLSPLSPLSLSCIFSS
uniref:Uncharacterized protein n=1 Tax=Guillardia theta TaxID=55529 RepID=A0A6U5WCL6_GUITH|mmetsp:Transcript_12992/g.45685  ORF Transcript_12992/g.45685 Transcript_12992/m.45685 type:complete len:222 (+) Transcript_12992:112-777(+)